MWLVIGYGNSLRSDDRFALEVCKELKSYSAIAGLAKIIAVHQLMPELIELISQASGVIFIDASVNPIPGQLQFISLDRAPINSPFSHHYTPQSMLSEADRLYGHTPPGYLCTAGGTNFELGEELSPLLKIIVPKTVQLILEQMGIQGVRA